MARPIIEIEELGSTNDWIAERAAAGAGDGLWVRADRQRAGRGRRGRAWVSEPGNLFLSTLARPRPGEGPPQLLSFVSALALDEALRGWVAADRLALKWPNDLLLDGSKVAGILLEAAPGGGTVIGFGVNLARAPEGLERPVVSLRSSGIEPPAPADAAAALVGAFARWRQRWRDHGFASVREAWQARSAHVPGSRISARLGAETVVGRYEELDIDGALLLSTEGAGLMRILAGDLSCPSDGSRPAGDRAAASGRAR